MNNNFFVEVLHILKHNSLMKDPENMITTLLRAFIYLQNVFTCVVI